MGANIPVILQAIKSGLALLLLLTLLTLAGGGLWLLTRNPAAVTLPPNTSTPSLTAPRDLALYAYLQLYADQLQTPSDTGTDERQDFSVVLGQTPPQIAQNLQEAGLISDARLFRFLLRYNRLDTSIEAGDYQLSPGMSMNEIALMLQQAPPKDISVTIPEGWRAEQIAEHLTETGVLDGAAFLALVDAGQGINHPVLRDHPAGRSYEGYLFPDTYRLPLDAEPRDLLNRMFDNLAAKLPPDTSDLVAARGYSFYEILTIASIVEREAVLAEERALIAGVYWNRLDLPSEQAYLEADPTVQYAMGYQPEADQWWKTPVTLAEYQEVDSPYNTYLYPGLPPGPIANPGIGAIVAALQPESSDYYYFVCRNPNCAGGEHVFARTYEEHLENAKRYWGQE